MPHYLIKQFERLEPKEQAEMLEELIASGIKLPNTKTDEIKLCLVSEFTEAAIELNKNWGKMQGISCGYPQIDRLTKGLVGGELIVIAGKTSYGKSLLSLNIANKVALADIPVLFVSLEMSKKEIASRYMHINGGSETDNYLKVSNTTAMQHNDELTWQSIDGLVRHAINEMKVGLIVIDHLHYFTRQLEQMSEDLGRITKEIKKNAIRYDIPIILISHVRRTRERANIDDLRGSSYIGQDADIVLMIERDGDDPTRLLVGIEKNRNRGFDYKDDQAELKLDGIKITDPTDIINTPMPYMD